MGSFTLMAVILGMLAVAFAVSALWQKSRAIAIVLALAIPVVAGALYWYKGAPIAVDPVNTKPPTTMPEAIAQLESLTASHPDNFGDQATLARAYMATEQYDKARARYEKALALQYDVDLSVEYAEALLRTSPDRRFPPQAVAVLQKALQANPKNQRALFFLGLHQRQSGQLVEAAETWQKLLALLDPNTTGGELRHQIDDVRKEAGLPPLPTASTSISVSVKLDPALAATAKPGAVLYVFARKADGAGPPVAVERLAPERWPVSIELGDEDSPMPTAKLSSQQEVIVAARLSQTGDAAPASGDLEADAVQVKVGDEGKVELTLSRALP